MNEIKDKILGELLTKQLGILIPYRHNTRYKVIVLNEMICLDELLFINGFFHSVDTAYIKYDEENKTFGFVKTDSIELNSYTKQLISILNGNKE